MEDYKALVQVHENIDSLNRKEIEIYKEELTNSQNRVKKLKSSRKKLLVGSSVGGIVLFLIGILIWHITYILEQ